MTYHEVTIKPATPFAGALIERLMETNCLGIIEDDNALIAYFPENVNIEAIRNELSIFQAIIEKTPGFQNITVSCAVIPHQDWNESWKKGFKPLDVGRQFTILPLWEEKINGRINLVIDPGMAFGTGHHETTRSCLVLMEKYADRSRKESFLDLGTGTGVLAIAASRLGYQHVLGIDTDPLAVEAAAKNCAVNNVANVKIRLGSLSDEEETFDVIAANLISGVLIDTAPALSRHLKPGGIAFLSGILAGQEEDVIEAMKKAALKLIEKYPDDKWVSLVVMK